MATAKVLKVRYSQIHCDTWSAFYESNGQPLKGDRVYVIEIERLAGAVGYTRGGNNVQFEFKRAPVKEGQLGTYNNVSRYSHGLYEVLEGTSTHLHLNPID